MNARDELVAECVKFSAERALTSIHVGNLETLLTRARSSTHFSYGDLRKRCFSCFYQKNAWDNRCEATSNIKLRRRWREPNRVRNSNRVVKKICCENYAIWRYSNWVWLVAHHLTIHASCEENEIWNLKAHRRWLQISPSGGSMIACTAKFSILALKMSCKATRKWLQSKANKKANNSLIRFCKSDHRATHTNQSQSERFLSK